MVGGILGFIGVLITLVYSYFTNKQNQEFQKHLKEEQVKNEMWRAKYNVLIQLISYRFYFASTESLSAMNSIPALFYDSNEVMSATKEFYDYSMLPDEQKNTEIANDKLVSIYMAIYKDLGIDENVDKVF